MAISLTRCLKKKNLYSEDLLIIQTTKPVRLSPETQIRLSCADHLTDFPSRKCLNKISHRFEITCCLMTVYVTNSKAQDDWILCDSESWNLPRYFLSTFSSLLEWDGSDKAFLRKHIKSQTIKKYEIPHYKSFSFPFQFINFYKWEKKIMEGAWGTEKQISCQVVPAGW